MAESAAATTRAIARRYVQRGWAPLPIPRGAKAPVMDEWQRVRVSDPDVDRVFAAPGNVGVLLGEPSGWLVDVDLDCPETVELARRLMPETLAFGRSGKRRSHLLFRSPGATTAKFADLPEPDLDEHGQPRLDSHGRPKMKRQMLVELRSTGGQTVFPGSVHPSGEPIEFEPGQADVLELEPQALRTLVARLASAALVARHCKDQLEAFLADPSKPPAATPQPVAEQINKWLGIARAPEPPKHHRPEAESAFSAAAAKFNADHPPTWTRKGAKCPACEGATSFKALPGDSTRWVCFHSGHTGCGTAGGDCWTGDALDLASFLAGRTPADHLRAEGYLVAPQEREEPPPPGDDDAPPEVARQSQARQPPAASATVACTAAGAAKVLSIQTGREVAASGTNEPPPIGGTALDRPLQRSYLTLCTILRLEAFRKRVLGDAKLELNEMVGRPTLDRRPVEDVDYAKLRERIEKEFIVGKKREGLRFSTPDITQAVHQIASESAFHPVRDYLTGLRWDGERRIENLPEGALNCTALPIVKALLRKWFISAVARAMDPGCKVDTMLILVGPQGAGKSRFFSTLAGREWFCDTVFDVNSKDSYLLLSRSWIVEWAELESMLRARDASSVKSFLSKERDEFRPPYGRETVSLKRSCVIVGTTNDEEFLSDRSGHRRYWPVRVHGPIDVKEVAKQRDQLWAEARAAYEAHEQWHLTEEEKAQLAEIHKEHEIRDAWEERVLAFAGTQTQRLGGEPLTVELILEQAIQKRIGEWTKGDQMRIASILQLAGYVRCRRRIAGARLYEWVRGGAR